MKRTTTGDYWVYEKMFSTSADILLGNKSENYIRVRGGNRGEVIQFWRFYPAEARPLALNKK